MQKEIGKIIILKSKLTEEARRCIIGNYYNNLEDFISKIKTIFAPVKTVSRPVTINIYLENNLSKINNVKALNM